MKTGTILGRLRLPTVVWAGSIGVLLALPGTARAHRLDEYLQATRLSLAPDRVGLEIDLTPGVDTAPTIFALIDVNHDGWISEAERAAYANQFLKEIIFEVDGWPRRVMLLRSQFPSFEEMSAGTGVIRIEARAEWAGAIGRHSLFYQNNHRQDLGAYLVNALLPESREIEITEQHRDLRQHEIRLGFNVRSIDASYGISPLPLAVSLAFTVLVWLWRPSIRGAFKS
jgi:hypothetical protein